MSVIDLHFHLMGNGRGSDDADRCYVSGRMKRTLGYIYLLFMTGLWWRIFKTDKTALRHLMRVLHESRRVDKAVFLALDKVYGHEGKPDMDRTNLYVPNGYAARVAKEQGDRVLYGASIHPYDPDASKRLDQAANDGAVLVKWLPSTQDIDLTDERAVAFCRDLAARNIPLLCHVGNEHTIPCADGRTKKSPLQRLNDPNRLEKILDTGVVVIAAHCGLPVDEDNDTDFSPDLAGLMKRFPNLYADLSGLLVPFKYRLQATARALRLLPQDRLLFGTDYPIPVSAKTALRAGVISREHYAESRAIKNPLDRTVSLLRNMGADDQVFTRAAFLLKIS